MLNRKLKKRPKRKELQKRNIGDALQHSLDAKLVPVARRLSMEFRKNHLSQMLRDRPPAKTLKNKNILHEKHGHVSSRMQYKAMVLEKAFRKDNLNKLLRKKQKMRGDVKSTGSRGKGRRAMDAQACAKEIHKAKENMRLLRMWLRRIPE